jgi:large subunit ribosomal protein L29
MKTGELRELPNAELQTRLDESKEELFNLRFQQATGQLENSKRLAAVRRGVAQVLTIFRERELGIQPEPEETTSRRRRRRGEEGAEVSAAGEPGGEVAEPADEGER